MALPTVDKKQITIIFIAIAFGIGAAIMVGVYVTTKEKELAETMSNQFEKAQQENKLKYDQDIALLNQRIVEVQASAKKSAEEAAKAIAAQKSAPAPAAAGAEGPKKKPSLAMRTPAGKRAITVEIKPLVAVGGLLNPGDFVDVIAHLDLPTGKKTDPKEKVTAMIFQNLQVLAINTNIDEPGAYDAQQKEQNLKVTFAVDPQETGLLAFAEQNGTLELVLRTPTEKGRTMLPAANWTTLGEYVLENSGADIHLQSEGVVSGQKPEIKVETENVKEPTNYIQIFRGGKEL